MDKRRKIHVPPQKADYLLSGMLKCGICGYRLTVDKNLNGNGHNNYVRMNYRCYSKTRHRADCDLHSIRVDNMDIYIKNLLFTILLNERYSRNIYKLIKDKIGSDYDSAKKQLYENQLYVDKLKQETQNLIASLAEAPPIAYQEIVKEIERKTQEKNDVISKLETIRKEMKNFPLYNPDLIVENIVKTKSFIKGRMIEDIKPVLHLLVKEIVITNESIMVHINLNAYINAKRQKDLEVVIEEITDNIRMTSNQFQQNMAWSSLVFKL